jgi:hypothetical protein
MQQWSILREQGVRNPDPIKSFYEDLSKQMEKWDTETTDIILMMDANEPLGDRPSGLGQLVGKHDLIDLSKDILPDEGISTYARGSKKIDFIFGTQ